MTELDYVKQAEAVKDRLYRTAYMYLGSEADAVEAVDEAVYRGFLSHRQLREPDYLKTWLTRILINVCVSELRRRKRVTGLDELPETAAEAYDGLPLRDAVDRLPKELKAVVILRYFSGLTIGETAAVLRVPAGTVATRQRRALALLRLELDDEQEVKP